MKKEQLIVFEALEGSLVVPPNKIKRFATIQRRIINQFSRELDVHKVIFENIYRKDCPDCD